MSADREALSQAHVEATRRVIRRAAELCVRRGAAVDDVAIGAAYAAFDVAERHAGPGVAAIEWLRTAIDVMERSSLAGNQRRPNTDVR